jgi:hypothetical protein
LQKYKTQSIVGILGLAVGFICFALSVMWIRYEMSYDSFHEGADRLYLVRNESNNNLNGSNLSQVTPYPLAAYLKENFPEVEDVCNTHSWPSEIIVDGVTHKVFSIGVDSAFMRFFQIEVLEGNLDFLVQDSKKVAITQEEAQKLFGNENPLGKTFLIYEREFTICAIVKGWSKHSNYPFDFLAPNYHSGQWNNSAWQTLIRLNVGVDAVAFAKKMYEIKVEKDYATFTKAVITPLTSLRYDQPSGKVDIKFEYIALFAVAGLLVIICSLFNTLTLFVTRFRIREKELALRKVSGATFGSLFALLSTEFLLMAGGAFILGLCAIHSLLAPFRDISEVSTPVSGIYGELAVYSMGIILISLLVFLLLLFFFQKRKLNVSIRNKNKNLSRKISIAIQLIISIGFIFCTTMMMKQIYFLHHVDMGIDFRKTAVVNIYPMDDSKVLEEQLKQMPEITATFSTQPSLIPKNMMMGIRLNDWDGKPVDTENLQIEAIEITKDYTAFYGFQLLVGEGIEEHHTKDEVWLNETAVKTLGWNKEEAVGKWVKTGELEKTVVGVFKDIVVNSPVVPVKPVIFSNEFEHLFGSNYGVLFRYQPKSWEACKKHIEALAQKEYPNAILQLDNAEETYDGYIKSEIMLSKLLSIISLVCILISVFGLFSLVSLSCEQRQKEMAIRKINGATVKDILKLFFGEYMILLIIGAVVAFPIAYFVMKKWVERYILQTEISAWIYLAIFIALGGIIVLCIGWRVYKASIENPAEVLKTE